MYLWTRKIATSAGRIPALGIAALLLAAAPALAQRPGPEAISRPNVHPEVVLPEDATTTGKPDPRPEVAAPEPDAADACCTLVSYHRRTGTGTARVLATGELVRFRLESRRFAGEMKPGRAMWIDTATGKLGIFGADACCTIVSRP